MSRDSAPTNPYRLLPSVDEALRDPGVVPLEERVGRELVMRFLQQALEGLRGEIQGGLDGEALTRRLEQGELARAVEHLVRVEEGRGVRRAVNVGGVVLNTGLGRSPVHPEVAEHMAAAARGYCVLEVDRFTGERNQRDERLSELLVRLTGCEAGIAVNNNAAAAMLCMHTFARGRQAIVSRGELVEIGGSFRVPDVMAGAGVELVEVGATNRTRIADYARAIGPDTGLLMKVHPSNFRVVGFTEEVDPGAMADLAREHGVVSAWDLGSGLIERDGMRPLGERVGGETEVRAALASGVDVVTFSGDKLLGGPQAGLLVGRREAIAALRGNALYRAMRCDKVQLAGLERTCELILAGRGDELPARALLLLDAEEVRPAAERIAAALTALGFEARAEASTSQPGSGSAPGVELPTVAVRVTDRTRRPAALAGLLRGGEPPVFARVHDDALWVDPRTLLPGCPGVPSDEELLLEAFRALAP